MHEKPQEKPSAGHTIACFALIVVALFSLLNGRLVFSAVISLITLVYLLLTDTVDDI